MRRICFTLFTLISLAGCSSAMVGTWRASGEAPKEVGTTFKQIEFKSGQDFNASARQGDKDVYMSGKYEYDGRTLTLKQPGKAEMKYQAVVWWFVDLELKGDGAAQRLRKQ